MDVTDIQTWWRIPSIVHFCKVFSDVCEDVFPINITEFEDAIQENSYLLTNMAIRFIKICGFYDPNTNEWWRIMKEQFKNKCIDYNFEYYLDSVTYYDDLTNKQKVESLYILCHIVLDLEHIQYAISNKPQLWNTLNIKPLGYDLNKSVYWYFGTTRLYREDFDNKTDFPNNLFTSHDIHGSLFNESYPSDIFASGNWKTICNDDNNSWYSIADITEYSKNVNIIYLHRSICNIIQTLPQLKRKKLRYKYLKSNSLLNVRTRYLRSMVNDKEDDQFIQNIKLSQTKYDSIITQLDKTKNNENVCDQNQYVSYKSNIHKKEYNKVGRKSNRTAMKLRFINDNTVENHSSNVNDFDLLKFNREYLYDNTKINTKHSNQENTQCFVHLKKRKLRSSTKL